MHRTKNREEKEGNPKEKETTTRPHSWPGAVPEDSPVSLSLSLSLSPDVGVIILIL